MQKPPFTFKCITYSAYLEKVTEQMKTAATYVEILYKQ